jgi:hypothetical protein
MCLVIVSPVGEPGIHPRTAELGEIAEWIPWSEPSDDDGGVGDGAARLLSPSVGEKAKS